MKPDQYNSLSEGEKLLYNEFYAFGKRVNDRLDEVSDLLKTLIAMIQEDPK